MESDKRRGKWTGPRDPWTEVNWGAQLADLKESDYRTGLLLSGLVQTLIDKGILSGKELEATIAELDRGLPAPGDWS